MQDIPAKIVRSHRRTLALHVLPDKSLLIKAPMHVSQHDIQSFISKNDEWIQKRLQALREFAVSAKKQYKNSEIFLYLGKPRILVIGKYKIITVQNEKLLFPDFLQFRIQKELTSWYIAQAKKIIAEQVEFYAKIMDAEYKSIVFSDTKSKWGHCTHDNHLQFNWRLVMAPLLVINYVVIHELAHTLEKNHSIYFWDVVRGQSPSYRQQRKWLKEYGHTLII